MSALTTTQKSLASRMIRYSDNDATDALLTQVTVRRCRIVADQLGMRRHRGARRHRLPVEHVVGALHLDDRATSCSW